jgi:hypothetical protein
MFHKKLGVTISVMDWFLESFRGIIGRPDRSPPEKVGSGRIASPRSEETASGHSPDAQ